MARDEIPGLKKLAEALLELYPEEAAGKLETADFDDAARLLQSLAPEAAARIVERLTPPAAAGILEAMEDRPLGSLLSGLEPARGALLLGRLDEAQRSRWLALVGREVAEDLQEIARYGPETAGGRMDPRVLAVRPEMTVRDVLQRLRRFRDRKVRRVFLIDGAGRLIGSVPLQELAIAEPAERIGERELRPTISVRATASLEEVIESLERYQTGALPVVDFDDRLVGVIRHDALLEATREDASADVQTMVGASKEERALSPVSFAVKKRLPWLEVNLGTAFLAAAVVALFEETISRNTALAVLLPVVAGQSGNTGSQALAVTMRGLALREVRARQWLRVCMKETKVAAINGVAVALTTSLFVFLWSRSVGLALVIGTSMVLSMAAAGMSGAGIPMLLTAIKQDPAQSSSIILTTVTDVVGFFSFLGIATLLSALL